MSTTYNNPIFPGFYPDPSICRVEDDYYLVTSTFAYFPGVPIFHSTDLIHWEQIGNILDRNEQLPLAGTETSEGIFAPTLRYHDGTFYMITTNVSNELGNFIVTAKDPKGPWSDPHPLGSEGIDPSLFFDDDGKCYYCGTKPRREGARYFGDNEIYIQELDLTTMKLVGESYPAWHGALRQVEWPEGPHIYKKDGYYYLMISEAGTAHDHAISIARSKSLTEPFTGHRGNPIMTHRHLGYNYPIVNVGHPDIVHTKNDEWFMVLLASRPYGGYYRNLGRETFLVPFTWENGWPVINPGKGIVEDTVVAPNLPLYEVPEVAKREDFDCNQLPYHFIYLRNPKLEDYSLTERPGWLTIKLSPVTLEQRENPSAVLVRQQSMDFTASTKLDFAPSNDKEEAGLILHQSQDFNYQFLVGLNSIRVIKVEKGEINTIASQSCDTNEPITLCVTAKGQDLTFSYSIGGDKSYTLIEHVDARILSTDVAGGFVGTCIGIYATSNGTKSNQVASFDYFEIQ